jgi:preprotein translocase SecE subunit
VARQTRSERRARRAAQEESQAVAQRPRPRQQQPQQQLRPTAEPAAVDGRRRLPGSGFRNFVIESWGELKKVDWPGQQQLIQGTAVVLIACLITGFYLFLADQVFKRFVQHVLLGG